MANRDGTGPQWKGPMTGRKMWKCEWWENVSFESWKGRRCGKWERRWMWNRWNPIEESEKKPINKED